MTTTSHLAHLLEQRRALLRDLARLDVAIAMERDSSQDVACPAPSVPEAQAAPSWVEALHRAKIPVSRDPFLPG